jgi:crotonobetainyl-CoA:carnitine CoA-transferase CaiB-like acyl-CoA transferase
METAGPAGAYAGIRVLDFTEGVAGPMAAMLLGDFGAEVVKVEPRGGDRLAGTPGYLAFNRNKQVLTLDLAQAVDKARAKALLAGADIALFDKSPSDLEASGLSAEALAPDHPGLIHAWLPPYGTKGRWRNLPPRHSLLAALSGYCWRQGAEADRPIHLVGPFAWYGQAVTAASAIGAALFERTRSGRGQGLVVSGLHGFAQVGGPVRALDLPRPPRTVPFGTNPRSRLYRCSDGAFIFVCAFFPSFYRKLFEVLGHGDVVDLFVADDEAARNLLDSVFILRPRDEWMALLKAADVPCAPVQDREAWLRSAVVEQAGLRLAFWHPTLGEVAMPSPPAALSATPMRVKGLPEAVAAPPAWPMRPAPAASAERKAPLAGVRVLNLGTVIAGALPGAMLSFLGADVVKVEGPGGDQFRYDPLFLALNRGTRSLGLDIARPDGRDLFFDLARQADVVIDNCRFGVRDRLGINYAALKAVNPRIISCSVTAYGDRGERAGTPGFDPLLQAESGIMSAQGGEDDPVYVTMGVNDVGAAGVVCASVIAALNARDRTGEGQEIRTSLLAQSLLFQLGELVTYAGRPATAKGGWDFTGPMALHRYYPCSDGWIGVACETEAEAAALSAAIDLDLGDLGQALKAPRDGGLAARIAARLAGLTRGAASEALLRAGVPAAPVIDMQEVFRDEELRQNRYVERWEHPRRGGVMSVGGYADFLATPGSFSRSSPEFAEHSREVLRDFGVQDAQVDAWVRSAAVFEFGGSGMNQ